MKKITSEVSAEFQENSKERRNIFSQKGSFNQHLAYNYLVLFICWSQESTDHGGKDKETDHLDSVMSYDDFNIRAGSLEEEAHELQALKVWRASERTSMGCNWISLYQPHPLEEREIRSC